MNCTHCHSENFKKNGKANGRQRYLCKICGRTFSDTPPKYSNDDRRKAIFMYLNNCGIRKTALFIGCSRTTVMNWVRDAKRELDKVLKDYEPNYSEQPDIIEFDEIYTYVKKNKCDSSYGLLTLGTKSVLLRL